MNPKKTTTLNGTLLRPLMVGCRALIRCGGHCLRTSRIVAIHSCTPEEVRFETMNTHYTLLPGLDPQKEADGTFLMCMAA